MSYFKTLIPSDGVNRYKLEVNRFGECVLTAYESDPNLGGEFVTGPLIEVLGRGLTAAEEHLDYRLSISNDKQLNRQGALWVSGHKFTRWRDIIALLNSGKRATTYKNIVRKLESFAWSDLFIAWKAGRGYVGTQRAFDADRVRDELTARSMAKAEADGQAAS